MQRLIPLWQNCFPMQKSYIWPKKSSSIPSTNGTPSFHPTTRNPTHQGFQRCQPLTRSDTTTTPVEGRKLAHTHTVRSWGNRLILPGTRVRCDHGLKIQPKSWRIGDFSQIINIQLPGLWKNSLKFRGGLPHENWLKDRSLFWVFLAGAVHNKFGFLWAIFGRPIFRCIAQFAAFTSEILERYFAGGWWWFCKKKCHKREWIPPEKNIRRRRFHYLNPLPSRSSSFVFALVFLDCLPRCWLVVKLLNQKKPPDSIIFVKVQKNNNWLPKHDWIHHHHCQQQLEQQQVVETWSGSLQNRNWNVHEISPERLGMIGDE